MKRKFISYPITDFSLFKTQLLNFSKRFGNFCFLDNQKYDFDRSYECIAGVGISKCLTAGKRNNLLSLNNFIKENRDWIFGHASYDIKNEIENLFSKNADGIEFPDYRFFVPEFVFILSKDTVEIGMSSNADSKKIFEEIINIIIPEEINFPKPQILSRFSKDEYLEVVKKLQKHILRGDCYEMCFCQEFFSENVQIDPVKVFKKLSDLSPNPFSAFYRSGEKYLMCASPERFLKKTKNVIISQPIKGTSRRTANTFENEAEKNLLFVDEKERAENIMIVDLVRNDLSKICTEGSVYVKEFLKVYSFPQVHQMISTITGKLRENISFAEILSATFPMGSMTGAPKKRAMELIEEYEKTKRGLFSGTVGYMNPDGDFDFNVVIRSILYNEKNKYLSIQAGSAITWKSIPQKEYDECNIKIEAMKMALGDILE
ncbi:MAG TPA: anthranilate synthase component I family protein [Hanamia sp.]|nr:anthranilate synthase component I family protein [Hanamia sp.]